MFKHKFLLLTGFLVFCFTVFIAGWTVGRSSQYFKSYNGVSEEIRLGPRPHKLVNPLLACQDAQDIRKLKQFEPFKNKVLQLITDKVKSGAVSDVALFFHDFYDGTSIDINQDDIFEPASLIKLPVMVAYLKLAGKEPGILRKKFTYDGKTDMTAGQFFKPGETLKPGKAYTVEELIHLMIAHSDNNSWKLLYDNLDKNLLESVYKDLGIEYSHGPYGEEYVRIRSYAIVLRVLYNASYLNEEMSEKALEFMMEKNYPFAIASGIPSNIAVASKFGEVRDLGSSRASLQFHDFGIIYYPGRPYMLSIMTKGNDYGKLMNTIKDLSQLVFKEFDARNQRLF